MPDETVRLRIFLLYDFLHEKRLLTERRVENVADVRRDVDLRNHHLTDDGYYFLQKYLPRWQRRLYKHTTAERERRLLEKWYGEYVSSRGVP